ncbi:SURF1 family protein [Streptomyces reniochalinae]|uniref:SURF1-like protein n=1 Tax=Streptomyces reniochalinae TaxID=2250578 RepID=A0A367F3W5_9ACTN|nr:SURF1 family protein [Streptomyces reniochalinae]RCG24200.1 SURF1 family protein [Streptomyces reniochalinae]
MYRFLLTPRWWGINIFAVLAIPVCLFMGSWQLSRFDDRVDRHHEQQEQSRSAAHAKARPLASLLPVTEETVGRTAKVTGRFDAEHPLLVPDRTVKGERGFYVLSLLRTDDTGDGKALPVVRGWLPGDPDPARVPAPPKGEVTVRGALQASESQNDAGDHASGALPRDQLGFINASALVNIVPYGVEGAWLTEQRTREPLKPVPPAAPEGTGLDMKAFQNLGYTAQWFVFAGFVVFMWFRFFRREAEMAKDAALGLLPEGEFPQEETDPGSGAEETGQAGGEDRDDPADGVTRAADPAPAPEGAGSRSRSPA